jgi:hypothetical protein
MTHDKTDKTAAEGRMSRDCRVARNTVIQYFNSLYTRPTGASATSVYGQFRQRKIKHLYHRSLASVYPLKLQKGCRCIWLLQAGILPCSRQHVDEGITLGLETIVRRKCDYRAG